MKKAEEKTISASVSVHTDPGAVGIQIEYHRKDQIYHVSDFC